jgi:hypothetical protein
MVCPKPRNTNGPNANFEQVSHKTQTGSTAWGGPVKEQRSTRKDPAEAFHETPAVDINDWPWHSSPKATATKVARGKQCPCQVTQPSKQLACNQIACGNASCGVPQNPESQTVVKSKLASIKQDTVRK